MCHMMYCPARRTPPREHLERVVQIHRDGAGSAVLADSGFFLRERRMDGVEAIDGFLARRKRNPDGTALFHARHATGDNVSRENIHPWMRGDGQLVVAHNGYLFSVPEGDKRSDTRIFCEEILPLWDLDSPDERAELEAKIGTSKMIILAGEDSNLNRMAYILNERLGRWDNGIWHSSPDHLGGPGRRQEAIDAGLCQSCGLPNADVGSFVPGASICELCAMAAEARREILMRGPSCTP